MGKYKNWITLGIVLAFGIVFRVFHNTDISLWHDEAFSALLIKYPWGEMFYRMGLDVHPPAYYVALRFWHYVFSDSLLSLRMFSVVFGVATIWMSYLLTKEITESKKIALWAAFLVAVNPFQIQYATEARMYTFGAFLAVAAAYLLVKGLDSLKNPQNLIKTYGLWLAFGLVAGTAALTHYYLLFTVGMLCLYGLLWTAYNFRTSYKKYLPLFLSYVVMALMYLPWLKWFIYQFKQVGENYWIPSIDKWSIPTTVWQLLIGTGVDISKLESQISVIAGTVFIAFVLIAFLRAKLNHKWLIVFGFIAPFVGSLLFFLLSLLEGSKSSVYLIRYFLYSASFLSILLAVWLSKLRIKQIGIFLLAVLVIANLYTFQKYWKDLNVAEKTGMASLQQELVRSFSPGDKIIVASSFEFFNLKYYLARNASVVEKNLNKENLASSKFYDYDDRQNCTIDCLNFGYLARPLLYSGGKTSTKQMSHFEGTAILTDQELYPHLTDVPSNTTVWMVWTNGFGGSKPEVPGNWTEVSEHGYAEVRPYVSTWVELTEYRVN